jgi:hypothetical protein
MSQAVAAAAEQPEFERLCGAVHFERNHQGLGNVIPFPSAVTPPDGRICRRERLGGLLNFLNEKPRRAGRINRGTVRDAVVVVAAGPPSWTRNAIVRKRSSMLGFAFVLTDLRFRA